MGFDQTDKETNSLIANCHNVCLVWDAPVIEGNVITIGDARRIITVPCQRNLTSVLLIGRYRLSVSPVYIDGQGNSPRC